MNSCMTSARSSRNCSGKYIALVMGSLQIAIEPFHGTFDGVGRILRIAEPMTFARIDHDLGRNAEALERVPEFLRLRRRTLDVEFAHVLKRRGAYVADEVDGRGLRIHGRVLVG